MKYWMIILKYRRPWLRLVCSCKEECAQKNKVLCSKGVHQRKSCKYCRFERCQSLAGLERKWVISGHIPMAENCKRSKSGSHTEWSHSNKLVRLILVAGKLSSNEKNDCKLSTPNFVSFWDENCKNNNSNNNSKIFQTLVVSIV